MSKPRSAPASNRKARPGTDVRHPRPDWASLALAAVGMLISGYLTYVAFAESPPALCSEGSGCDLIQQSRWSRLFGVPIALWGFATYTLIAAAAVIPTTRLQRWRRLWSLSLIGFAISVYLTVFGLVELQATCTWCMASLVTLTALLVMTSLRRPPSGPGLPWNNWLISHAALLLCILGVMQLYYSGLFTPRPQPRLQALAAHLTQTGAVFYGASWCPTCNQQKALFGGAADELPYVECSPQGRRGPFAMVCVNAEVRNFPTWVIRGRNYDGLKQPEELAALSAFDWSGFGQAAKASE